MGTAFALGVGAGVGVTTSPLQAIRNTVVAYSSTNRVVLNLI